MGLSETWLVWLVIYLVFIALIYIAYTVTLNKFDYPNKKDRSDVLWILIVASAITFVLSGALVIFDLPLASAALLFVSIVLDFISGGIIGTVSLENGQISVSRSLAYTSLSPMAYKMLLFGYITYLGGFESGFNSESLADAPGRKQFASVTSKFAKKDE